MSKERQQTTESIGNKTRKEKAPTIKTKLIHASVVVGFALSPIKDKGVNISQASADVFSRGFDAIPILYEPQNVDEDDQFNNQTFFVPADEQPLSPEPTKVLPTSKDAHKSLEIGAPSYETSEVKNPETVQREELSKVASNEEIEALAEILHEEVGNTQENWKSRVENALNFALYLKDHPEIFDEVNNFRPSLGEIRRMKERFQELQEEYETKGANASMNAKIIGLGLENGQLGADVFENLGAPLTRFSYLEFLTLWGTEDRFAIRDKEPPKDWSKTGMVTNPFKGSPLDAVLDENYNPYDPYYGFRATVYNARYFQTKYEARASEEKEFTGNEWLSMWNPGSRLWKQRWEQYHKVIEEFIKDNPRYSFLTVNKAKSSTSPQYQPIPKDIKSNFSRN